MIGKINKTLVEDKLSRMVEYIKELEPMLKLDTAFLLDKNNYRDLRALERDFQLIVDVMIEINSHLIKQLELNIPDDYTNSFITLGQNNILPAEFTNGLAKVVGLRNKVVHKYDIIDQKKFINDLKTNAGQFGEYMRLVNECLKK